MLKRLLYLISIVVFIGGGFVIIVPLTMMEFLIYWVITGKSITKWTPIITKYMDWARV